MDKEWVFEERDRGHVIFSSGVGTKNQCNQSKDRQTTRLWWPQAGPEAVRKKI